ncbi:trypsin-like serine peptidase [Chlorogloeopsis fritschii PCC 9212]|uniref:trypsin-like serine peptidase n=1 Tax=Chlorogloeopsis fritschii TaxID=1124 RepID=UPI001F3988A7|nr:trypsin-like peptidase domain-containing protein [Chlorogloeopsis fritschii]
MTASEIKDCQENKILSELCTDSIKNNILLGRRNGSINDLKEEPRVEDALAGGGDEIPEDDVNKLLAEVRKQEPVAQLFEFMGSAKILSEAEYQKLDRARQKRLSQMSITDFERASKKEDADRDLDDTMTLVSADGRIYQERVGVIQNLPERINTTSVEQVEIPAKKSKPTGFVNFKDRLSLKSIFAGIPNITLDFLTVNKKGVADSFQIAEIWGGSDGRQLRTSANWAWRAVGVSLRLPDDLDFSICSGSMIAPRVVLTSAHCVSPDGKSLRSRRAAPAARGESYTGNKFPFGTRFVEWYVWPSKWKGQDTARYDYAMLILRDINWSPGWVFVGTKSNIAYASHNTAGYPSNNNNCQDAPPSANGKCDGFMYRQYERIRTAGYGYFFHEFDTNDGQSGSPIYEYQEPTFRKVFGVNEGSVGRYNTATRINKSSFGLICKVLNGDFKYEINGETRTAKSSFFSNPKCD